MLTNTIYIYMTLITLPTLLAEWVERPPATQRYDACAWVRIPVSPGKNLSKMISQVRSNLNSAHLDIIHIYIYIYI